VGVYGQNHYRDKKVVGVFVRFRAPSSVPLETHGMAYAFIFDQCTFFARAANLTCSQ
jgi:hypothetical protein